MKSFKGLAIGVAVGTIITAFAFAQHEGKQPEMKLPDGWTMEDMQKCMMAGEPGDQHKFLAKLVGTWNAETKMWMGPGSDPMTSQGTWTMTSMYDGRYIKTDVDGDVPGMGKFVGMGITGFDNVSQEFVGSWIDSHSSGILPGKAKLSADNKTMEWTYAYNCPLTKKASTFRHIEHFKGDNAMTVEMFGIDPKSNKEYKMMHVELTKK
jgi:hypothetical protein